MILCALRTKSPRAFEMTFVKVRLGEKDVSEKKFIFSKKNRFSEFGEVSGPHFGIARFGWRFQP